jgi:peptidoglycan/LPS O-acetylase OafA/YrhL
MTVMAFHLGWSFVPGGAFGVSLFFTLSGYLITQVMLADHDRVGKVDLKRFWTRRLRRLVPGSIVCLIAVTVVAYMLPGKVLKISEIGMIALTAMATFAILDTYAPSVGASARTGAGFGIGAGLVGFPA